MSDTDAAESLDDLAFNDNEHYVIGVLGSNEEPVIMLTKTKDGSIVSAVFPSEEHAATVLLRQVPRAAQEPFVSAFSPRIVLVNSVEDIRRWYGDKPKVIDISWGPLEIPVCKPTESFRKAYDTAKVVEPDESIETDPMVDFIFAMYIMMDQQGE